MENACNTVTKHFIIAWLKHNFYKNSRRELNKTTMNISKRIRHLKPSYRVQATFGRTQQ
jgi:hypothetical protein